MRAATMKDLDELEALLPPHSRCPVCFGTRTVMMGMIADVAGKKGIEYRDEPCTAPLHHAIEQTRHAIAEIRRLQQQGRRE
jgi:hypothetical protein